MTWMLRSNKRCPKDSKSLSICGCDSYMLVARGRLWGDHGSCFLNSTCTCVKIWGGVCELVTHPKNWVDPERPMGCTNEIPLHAQSALPRI